MSDIIAPVLSNLNPVPLMADADIDAIIYLNLTDDVNIRASSVVLQVKVGAAAWEIAWTGEAAQAGFTVVQSEIKDGYRYGINPDADFPILTIVQVRIQATDTSSNAIDETYLFQTKDPQFDEVNAWNFATPDVKLGSAKTWVISYNTSGTEIAPIESSILPHEGFEAGWGGGNQLGLEAFADANLTPAKFNSSYGTEERYDYEWKRPLILYSAEFANTNRPSPLYPNPNEALTVGQKYRDLENGGYGYVQTRDGTDEATFIYVDWLHPVRSSIDHFMEGLILDIFGSTVTNSLGNPVTGHRLAEAHRKMQVLGTSDGNQKRFIITASNTPIHPKVYNMEALCHVEATIAGVTYKITDNGQGKWVCTSDILQSIGNTIDYETGDVDIALQTSPDSGTDVKLFYEYGDIRVTWLEESATNLPTIVSVTKLDPSDGYTGPVPPYNHTNILEFQSPNLDQAEIGSAQEPETFEKEWLYGAPPVANDASIDEFAPANIEQGIDETCESGWGWSPYNESAIDEFTGGDISVATFEIGGTAQEETFDNDWEPITV